MQITRFGHSAVLVDVAGKRILIDPGAFSDGDVFELEGLDAIVVTHQHVDHVDPDRIGSLQSRNPDAECLTDPETAALMNGFRPHTAGDITEIGLVTITGVGTMHAEILPTLPRIANTGVMIHATDEPTFFHPGDSYTHAPDRVDVLAAPLSAPWAKVSETVDFVRRIAPRTVFPIHDAGIAPVAYGIYWGHVSNNSGVDDARQVGPREAATLT